MQKVLRLAPIPPSLRRVYWFFRGCGYVAIVALITFIVLIVAIFIGYQVEDAMLSAAALVVGFGGIWMLGLVCRC